MELQLLSLADTVLGERHMQVTTFFSSSSFHPMNEMEAQSTMCGAKHTGLLYFQTTLTHISLTAFQKMNL